LLQLPHTLGEISTLQVLHIHGNSFTAFNRNLSKLTKLQELSLEWFLYAKPPKARVALKTKSPVLFSSLQNLCTLLEKHKKQECDVVEFLVNYSDTHFDVNHIDNRLRTPLHNCASKGDIGVLKGLLKTKGVDPNILDKDQCTPLCLAIREEKFDVAKILLSTDCVDVNIGGGIFGSPLHLAVVKLETWLI
jgi:hypothetical protein